MNNCSSNYSTRLRSRANQPVYTSDKRAKFTQRENKKWIRFVTVLGYIFFVSLPAVSLSVYYIYIWDPGYIYKFPPDIPNSSSSVHSTPIVVSARLQRNSDLATAPMDKSRPKLPDQVKPYPQTDASHTLDLAAILAEGVNSMESSAEAVRSSSGAGSM